MNNKEFVPVPGDNSKISEAIRKLRTETAYSIKRADLDLMTARPVEAHRFEEIIKKIMNNLGSDSLTELDITSTL